ncbi:hypothetical protein P3T21_006860 [Paraburkholderia sp. GAS334]
MFYASSLGNALIFLSSSRMKQHVKAFSGRMAAQEVGAKGSCCPVSLMRVVLQAWQ